MTRSARTVLLGVLLVLVMAGCAPPPAPEQAEEVCTDVTARVSGLAEISAYGPLPDLLPVVDAQLAAARDGRAALAGITPEPSEQPKHGALLLVWDDAVLKLGAFRVIRASIPNPAESNLSLISIYAAQADVAAAVREIAPVALRSDTPACARIPWRVFG